MLLKFLSSASSKERFDNCKVLHFLSMVVDHCLRVNGQKKILLIPGRFLYASIEIEDVICTYHTNMT